MLKTFPVEITEVQVRALISMIRQLERLNKDTDDGYCLLSTCGDYYCNCENDDPFEIDKWDWSEILDVKRKLELL